VSLLTTLLKSIERLHFVEPSFENKIAQPEGPLCGGVLNHQVGVERVVWRERPLNVKYLQPRDVTVTSASLGFG
jgi:hypothetical protein